MMQRLCEGSTNDATATVCTAAPLKDRRFLLAASAHTHTHTISLLRTLNDSFFLLYI